MTETASMRRLRYSFYTWQMSYYHNNALLGSCQIRLSWLFMGDLKEF